MDGINPAFIISLSITKILKAFNIVESERVGKNIIYYIKNNNIEEVLNVGVDCL